MNELNISEYRESIFTNLKVFAASEGSSDKPHSGGGGGEAPVADRWLRCSVNTPRVRSKG